jgi:hypothetical protein
VKYILLTSCFSPILRSNVSNIDVAQNIELAYQSLQIFLSSSLCLKHGFRVLFVDCSDFEAMDASYQDSIRSLFVNNSHLRFYNVRFSRYEIALLQSRGKGFSEMLMLSKFFSQNSFPSKSVFLKSSARYIPLFRPTINFPFRLSSVNSFSLSNLARKAICHSYLCDLAFLMDFIDFSLSRLDDASGSILEILAYQFIASKDLCRSHRFQRSFYYPLYNPKVLPGTLSARPFSSALFFQFLRSLACLF